MERRITFSGRHTQRRHPGPEESRQQELRCFFRWNIQGDLLPENRRQYWPKQYRDRHRQLRQRDPGHHFGPPDHNQRLSRVYPGRCHSAACRRHFLPLRPGRTRRSVQRTVYLPLNHLRISARRLRHIYGPSDSVLLIPRHPALGIWEHLRLSVRRRVEMSRTTNEHSSTCLPTLTKSAGTYLGFQRFVRGLNQLC